MTTTEKPGDFPRIEAQRRRMLVRLASRALPLEIRRDTLVPEGFIVKDQDIDDSIERVNALGNAPVGGRRPAKPSTEQR